MRKRKCKECKKVWYCEGDKTNCINLAGLDSCNCKTCWKKKYPTGNSRQECFSGCWRIA